MNQNLENLLSCCQLLDDYEQASPALSEASSQFVHDAIQEPDTLGRAAIALPNLPLAGAAWLATLFGAVIEQGGQAKRSAPAVFALFFSCLEQLPEIATEDSEPEFDAAQQSVLRTLPRLCPSVLAHLARQPTQREQFAQDSALMARLNSLLEHSYAIRWVHEALLRCSGQLLVLHPLHQIGFSLQYENVGTCFHLFSLIQATLGTRMPGGQSPDPALAAVARGQQTSGWLTDTAWWHYGDAHSKTAEFLASIWGESPVRTVPVIDDQQVILLWPPVLKSRSWESSFFGPVLEALPPRMTIKQQLDQAQCRHWFDRLGLKSPSQNPVL